MNLDDDIKSGFIRVFLCFILLVCSSAFGFSGHANFILVSDATKPTYVEMTNEKGPVTPIFIGHSNQLKNVLTFYSSSDSEFPNAVAIKNKLVFLVEEGHKFEILGSFLPLSSKILAKIEDSVSQGHVLLGFVTKSHQAGALVVDAGGVVYAVIRNSNRLFSIKPLGQLNSFNG